MAELNFPSNPTIGQTHTVGSTTWTWNGVAWVKSSGQNKIFNVITATQIYVTSSTQSTGTTTGALVVGGGVGIAGDLYVGGFLYGTAGIVITTSSFAGEVTSGVDINVVINTTTNIVTINNISTLQSVTGRGSTTTNAITIANTFSSTSTSSGALIVKGGIATGGNIWAHGRINSESLKIEDSVFDSSSITLNNVLTTVIDSYPINQFRSAKYIVQISEGTGTNAKFEMIEISLIVDNVGTVYATEYGLLTSNGELGAFAADVQIDDVVRLYFTPYAATTKTLKVLRTGMSV